LLTDKLRIMILWSALIGAFSGVLGLTISYHASIASGASVVLVATGLFILAFLFSPKAGLVTTTIRRKLHYSHPERDRFDEPGDGSQEAKSSLRPSPAAAGEGGPEGVG